MTAAVMDRPLAHSDEQPTSCPKCDLPHVTKDGHASCKAHSKRTAKPCTQPPINGTTVCRLHGGNAPQVREAATQRLTLERQRETVAMLGGSIIVDPAEGMLAMIRESAFNVAWYRSQLDSLVAEVDETAEGGITIDDEGKAHVSHSWVSNGIAGRVDPMNWKVEPHVLVKLYNEERDRFFRQCAEARKVGVEERLVAMAEDYGRVVVTFLEAVLAELGLTPEQADKVPAIIEAAVTQMSLGAA